MKFLRSQQLNKNILVGVGFVIIVATICQLLFSNLGFNPTDDGFVLAGSRRILDGEYPHKDFISIRPVGSYFLYSPLISVAGDYVIYASRFIVWLEFAVIAFLWITILNKKLNLSLSTRYVLLLAFIIFVFCVHSFPIMVWSSIDALLFSTIGILLCFSSSVAKKCAGYFFIGMSILFRLNFLPLVIISILLFGDWKKKRFWLMLILPGFIYFLYALINNALIDTLLQLTAQNTLSTVVLTLLLSKSSIISIIGIFIGAVGINLAKGYSSFIKDSIERRLIGIIMLILMPIAGLLPLALSIYYYSVYSKILFATLIGVILVLFYKERLSSLVKMGLLIILIAFSVSLSAGYTIPSLFSGVLSAFLILVAYIEYKKIMKIGPSKKNGGLVLFFMRKDVIRLLTLLLVLLVVMAFSYARYNVIYRESPAKTLNSELGDVLAGGRFIKVDNNTFKVLMDLNSAVSKIENSKEFCILADYAAYWIKSNQRNPLPSDWPNNVELATDKMKMHFEDAIQKNRGNMTIILGKYWTERIAYDYEPFPKDNYIVNYIKSNLTKIGETEFFELYE
jgi:hypothetical protein